MGSGRAGENETQVTSVPQYLLVADGGFHWSGQVVIFVIFIIITIIKKTISASGIVNLPKSSYAF